MTLLLLFSGGASGPAPPDVVPGGGGMGAVMSDAFFQRYTPAYQPRGVATRYKPTIRTQKKR